MWSPIACPLFAYVNNSCSQFITRLLQQMKHLFTFSQETHIWRPGSIGRGGWSLFWKWIWWILLDQHCCKQWILVDQHCYKRSKQSWWMVMRMILTWRTDIRCWILMDLMERIEGEGESKLIWKYFHEKTFWLHLFISDPSKAVVHCKGSLHRLHVPVAQYFEYKVWKYCLSI